MHSQLGKPFIRKIHTMYTHSSLQTPNQADDKVIVITLIANPKHMRSVQRLSAVQNPVFIIWVNVLCTAKVCMYLCLSLYVFKYPVYTRLLHTPLFIYTYVYFCNFCTKMLYHSTFVTIKIAIPTHSNSYSNSN